MKIAYVFKQLLNNLLNCLTSLFVQLSFLREMRLFVLCFPLVLVSIICPIGGRPGQKGTECVGKTVSLSDGTECLLEKYGTKILGKNGQNEQLRNAIAGLGKKQLMLEALFGKISENNIDSSSDQFKFFKGRLAEINRHDPGLSQLLEGLIDVQIHAKKALQNENTADQIRTIINTVKQSLANAVYFLANRYQIRLGSARGEGNDQKSLLMDSLNFYNEFEKDEQNAIKCRNSKKNDYYGKNGNEQRERFVRFVYRSLETKWDGSAFSNGQNDDNDDNTDEKRTTINTVKQSLANAVYFLANRYQIRLDSARGEGNDQKPLLIDLFNFYNEFEKEEQKAIKCKNSQKTDYDGKNGNEQRERFVRFFYRTLETKWDESAFSNGQNDDDDDAIGRRKRRKRRFIPPPPMAADYKGEARGKRFTVRATIVPIIISVLFLLFISYIGLYCCCNRTIRRQHMMETPASTALQMYNKLPRIKMRAQNTKECTICLSSIDPGTMVRPLPSCKHIFHDKCIRPWVSGHSTCPSCRADILITSVAQTGALGNQLDTASQNGIGSFDGQTNGTVNQGGTTASHEVAIDVQLDANNQTNATGGPWGHNRSKRNSSKRRNKGAANGAN